jgi:hypothetical protein
MDHTRDAVLRRVCDLMLGDEAQHVEFHRERFAEWQSHWLPLGQGLWSAQFQVFFVAAAQAAWFDHRPALTAVGADRRAFFGEARRECAAFLGALKPAGVPAGSVR